MANISLPEKPRLLSEVALLRPQTAAEGAYIVTNLQTGKHLRLSAMAYRIASQLDGQTAINDILLAQGDGAENDKAIIGNIIALLATHGFIANFEETEDLPSKAKQKPLESYAMSSRHPLLDARGLLATIGPFTNWLFTRVGFCIWGALMISALYMLLSTDQTPQSFIGWLFELTLLDGVVLTLLILAGKAVHELGHAIALQKMAFDEGLDPGPIKIGVTRFFFFLLPYTDATASWRISSRSRRAIIALGGVYLELFLAAIAVMLAVQVSNEVAKAILFQFAFIAGISTLLFNLNPFIKLDGYHLLSDALNTQNLQPRSVTELNKALESLFFKAEKAIDFHMGYVLYAIGSFAFRCVILFSIMIAGYMVTPALGMAIAVTAIIAVIVRPGVKFISRNWQKGVSTVGLATFCCLLFVPMVPVRETITVSGLIENDSLQNVILPAGTSLTRFDDQLVFDNRDLTQKIKSAKAELAISKLDYQSAIAARDPRSQQIRDRVKSAEERLARLLAEQETLAITIPPGFHLYDHDMAFYTSQTLSTNQSVGVLVNPDKTRIKIFIPETSLEKLKASSTAYQVKYWEEGQLSPGISELASRQWDLVQSLPSPILDRKFGGLVMTRPGNEHAFIPATTFYSTMINPETQATHTRSLKHGQRVTAVISTGWTVLARVFWEKSVEKFSTLTKGRNA